MSKIMLNLIFLFSSATLFMHAKEIHMQTEMPKELYKIISEEQWEQSENQDTIVLSKMDTEFIHFATIEQLDRITKKYWGDVSYYITLTIDPTKLPGKLILESNPGGSTKYYHLYNGAIPKDAITYFCDCSD